MDFIWRHRHAAAVACDASVLCPWQETTWEPPHGIDLGNLRMSQADPAPPPPMDLPPPPQLPTPAALTTLPTYPPQVPHAAALPAPPQPPAAAPALTSLPPGWEAHEDDETGAIYFYNVDTQETTWEAPRF